MLDDDDAIAEHRQALGQPASSMHTDTHDFFAACFRQMLPVPPHEQLTDAESEDAVEAEVQDDVEGKPGGKETIALTSGSCFSFSDMLALSSAPYSPGMHVALIVPTSDAPGGIVWYR